MQNHGLKNDEKYILPESIYKNISDSSYSLDLLWAVLKYKNECK